MCEETQSPDTKRARRQPDQHGGELLVASRGNALLPAEILALSHVTTLIEEFLMTVEEAFTKAARSGQAAWLDQLLDKCECSVPDALVSAAASDHLDCVKMLLDDYPADPSKESWGAVRKAAQAAADNRHLLVLERLMSNS